MTDGPVRKAITSTADLNAAVPSTQVMILHLEAVKNGLETKKKTDGSPEARASEAVSIAIAALQELGD